MLKQYASKLRDDIYHLSFYDRDLAGACAVASFFVHKKAIALGLNSILNHGYYKEDFHCWVSIDNIIIDITATQFGIKRKIFITKSTNKNYKSIRKFISNKAPKYFDDWGTVQNPKHYKMINNELRYIGNRNK